MIVDILRRLLVRDLITLKEEILAYPDEKNLWRLLPGLRNSAGTLTLHLAGNLQHFVGAQLGGTGYVRDREAEFARRDVLAAELVGEIDATLAAVETTMSRLPESSLALPYPLELGDGLELSTAAFLMHLSTHLSYHLGQIDEHRRFVTRETGSIQAVSFRSLG